MISVFIQMTNVFLLYNRLKNKPHKGPAFKFHSSLNSNLALKANTSDLILTDDTSTNLNNYTTTIYAKVSGGGDVNNRLNTFVSGHTGLLTVSVMSGNIFQSLIDYTDGIRYIRTYTSSSWSAWK